MPLQRKVEVGQHHRRAAKNLGKSNDIQARRSRKNHEADATDHGEHEGEAGKATLSRVSGCLSLRQKHRQRTFSHIDIVKSRAPKRTMLPNSNKGIVKK